MDRHWPHAASLWPLALAHAFGWPRSQWSPRPLPGSSTTPSALATGSTSRAVLTPPRPSNSAPSTSGAWPPHPGWHNPWVALLFYLKVSELDSVLAPVWGSLWGNLVLTVAALGTVAAWIAEKAASHRRALAWTLLLWLPVPFYAWSVAYGSVPIFFPAWWPYTWYNTRYGLELLPALALGLGFAASSAAAALAALQVPRIAQLLPDIVFALLFALAGLNATGLVRQEPIVYVESTKNLDARLPYDQAIPPLLQDLLSTFPRGTVLMNTQPILKSSPSPAFPCAKPSTRAISTLWRVALEAPASHAAIVVAFDGDEVDRAVKAHPEGFTLPAALPLRTSPRRRSIPLRRSSIARRSQNSALQISTSALQVRKLARPAGVRQNAAIRPRNLTFETWHLYHAVGRKIDSLHQGPRLRQRFSDRRRKTPPQDHDRAELTRRLCQRNTGIGADGIEFFAWTNLIARTGTRPGPAPAASACTTPTAPSPKSAATARAAWPRGWPKLSAPSLATSSKSLTDAGLRICRIDSVHNGDTFTVEVTTGMGVPSFVPHTLKLLDGVEIIGVEVSTGNPHFVILVDNAAFTVAGQILASDRRRNLRAPRFSPPDQRGICAHRERTARSRFASSSAAWGQPLLPAPAAPPRPQRRWRCAAAFRRSRSSLPAARRPLHGTVPATELYLTGSGRAHRPRRGMVTWRACSNHRLSQRALPSASSRPRLPRNLSASSAASPPCSIWALRPSRAPTLCFASRSTLPELPQQRLADLHAAFADPDTGAIMCPPRRLRFELPARRPRPRNHRRASQAVFRLQRPHRHSTPPARRAGPARLSRPHARRRFLSSKTACISKAFAPHSPASLTASAPPKACASSSPPHKDL